METSVAVSAENAGNSRAQRTCHEPAGKVRLSCCAGMQPQGLPLEQWHGCSACATAPSEGAGQPGDSHQHRPPGTSTRMRQGRAEYKERGKGCLLSRQKQTSHSFSTTLSWEPRTSRSYCSAPGVWQRITEHKYLKQQAGRLEVGRWEDCVGDKQLEIQEGMDDWQKWWLQFNKQIPQLQSGKYHKKHTTLEKVIKHPSSIQLNIHSSKLIIILGLLVLWVKDSGFPGPFYVRKRATRHQNHWHQEANSQSVTIALRQYEQNFSQYLAASLEWIYY